jgi:hypothetical protein
MTDLGCRVTFSVAKWGSAALVDTRYHSEVTHEYRGRCRVVLLLGELREMARVVGFNYPPP